LQMGSNRAGGRTASANTAQGQSWFSEELQVWRPPEKLAISEWAEKYRVLSEPAEEKGPLRLRRTPYLVPIMDAFLKPHVETVVFCKPAQIAGTEGMLSVIGYFTHQEPCSIMLIMADEDTAKYIGKERLQPMYRNSSELRRLIVEERFNITEMSLSNGAFVALGWASSVARLASRPMRIVIFDEVDKPGYYVTTREASPINLGKQRTETFFNRKIGILSSPTDEEGNIWKELNSCDAIFDWHVPCSYCGHLQPLRFSREFSTDFPDGVYRAKDGSMRRLGQVAWEGGRKATSEQIERAGYQCGECGKLWNTIEKNQAVEFGEMVSRSEPASFPKKVGFHINRLYSLLGKSGNIPKIVSDWIGSLDDPREKQGFINATLAEPWRQILVSSTESEVLKARCALPPQIVPQTAVALTCGIDVQAYGFWFVVRAWAPDMMSWLIHYGQIQTWADVEALLFEREYPIEGNPSARMRIWRAGIDTGGGKDEALAISQTEETYQWLLRNRIGRECRVWGTKGASSHLVGRAYAGNPLLKTPSGRPIPGGLQLMFIDTHKMKDVCHFRLGRAIETNSSEAEGGVFHQAGFLHSKTGADYASQILAEEKRRDVKRGTSSWVKVASRPNHLLDCEVITHVLADSEWPGGGVNLLRIPQRIVKADRETGSERKLPETSRGPTEFPATHFSCPHSALGGRMANPRFGKRML
jgi:terminase, large subunit